MRLIGEAELRFFIFLFLFIALPAGASELFPPHEKPLQPSSSFVHMPPLERTRLTKSDVQSMFACVRDEDFEGALDFSQAVKSVKRLTVGSKEADFQDGGELLFSITNRHLDTLVMSRETLLAWSNDGRELGIFEDDSPELKDYPYLTRKILIVERAYLDGRTGKFWVTTFSTGSGPSRSNVERGFSVIEYSCVKFG